MAEATRITKGGWKPLEFFSGDSAAELGVPVVVRWVAARFGHAAAVFLSSGIARGVSLAFVSWAMSW